MSAEPLVVPRVAAPGPSAEEHSPSPSLSTDEPAGRPQRGDRLAVLDGLRLVAALMVVLVHYTHSLSESWGEPAAAVFPRISRITGFGFLGPMLFFLISGFVICMSAWGRDLGRFFVSRVTRLFPAYWFAVLLTAAVLTVLGPEGARPHSNQLFVNLTMLQRPAQVTEIDGVYWTLWEELHFYLLFAIVVWRGLTYRRVVAFCMVWTVASVVVTASPDPAVHLIVGDATSPFFVAGVAFFLIYRFGPNLLLWGLVGVSWAMGLQRLVPIVDAVSKAGLVWWPGVVLVVTGIFAIIAAVALHRLSWIRGRWLTVAGDLTYPLYLLHLMIGITLISRLHDYVPSWPLLIAMIAAMLVLAWLVHRFVERPLAPLVRRRLSDAVAQIRAGGSAR